MNRNLLLVLGAICWSVAAIDGVLHLINGDLVVPVAMIVVAAVWVGLRTQMLTRRSTQAVAVPVEA